MPNVLLLDCDKGLLDRLCEDSRWQVAVATHSDTMQEGAPSPLHWNLILDDCCNLDTNDLLTEDEAQQRAVPYHRVSWHYLAEARRAHALSFRVIGDAHQKKAAVPIFQDYCGLATVLRYCIEPPQGHLTLEFNPADDRAAHLADFLDEFAGLFRSSRIMNPNGNSWAYEQAEPPVLFRDVYDDPVVALGLHGSLEWLLLPNIEDKHARLEAFVHLCYRTAPKLWPDVYSDLFHPRKVQALEQRLSQVVAERRTLQHDIEAEIDAERRFYAPYVNLTVVGDDVLKDLVRKVFEEVFGCKVNDLDEEVEAHEDKTLDLFVTCGDWSAMLEVRSSGNRNARVDDLERLDDNYKLAAERYGKAKSKILVFNGMYSRDPAKRKQNPAFGTGIIREAKVRKIGLVSTQQLLEAIEAHRNEEMTQEQFVKALRAPGLFQEPWK